MQLARRLWNSPTLRLTLVVTLAVSLRLPFLRMALSADEAGFLIVGGQWHPGTSLYGDYWVDRPPGLLAIFAVADSLGGAVPLRLIGCLAVALAVLAAYAIGRTATGRPGAAWTCAALVAALSAQPVFDGPIVSGELLALPCVLGALAALVRAVHATDGRSRAVWWVATGAGAVAAMSVKQNFVEVGIAAAVAIALGLGGSRLRALCSFAAGAAAVAVPLTLLAVVKGTSLSGLMYAVVGFRAQAGTLIASSASSATTDRLARYPIAVLVSGVGAIAAYIVWGLVRRRRERASLVVLAVLAWEIIAVLAGGSYWLHYLIGLVPGLVLGVTWALGAPPSRLRVWLPRLAVGWALVSAVFLVGGLVAEPIPPNASVQTGVWLADYVRPGDTGVVAYGQPNILRAAGLSSPYPYLWSLPVRVEDPALHSLDAVLRGPTQPVWLVVWHDLSSWGINADRAKRIVARDYRVVQDVCGFQVYLLRGEHRLPKNVLGDSRCTATSYQPLSPG